MEKQITLSQIKATFTKDFETFGKMDPFVVFNIGQSEGKTETIKEGGKEPVWQQTVTLHYFDEASITVKAFEEDMTSNEFMGEGKIQVKSLEKDGTLQIKVELEGEGVGEITCKYELKTLPPAPMLTVKNVKCDFYKETKFMLKTKPYFVVQCGSQSMVTEPQEEGNSKLLQWSEALRVKVQQEQKLVFNVMDKSDNSKIFGYEASVGEFKTLAGKKKIYIINNSLESPQLLGALKFNYDTDDFVSNQESIKNEGKAKKEEKYLRAIKINQIKGKLTTSGQNIYFKINTNLSKLKTKHFENAKKDFILEINNFIYAEKNEDEIIVDVYNNDDYLGNGTLSLNCVTSGSNKVELNSNSGGQLIGSILLDTSVKTVLAKYVSLSDLKVKLGDSEPYVNGRIGSWTSRAQTERVKSLKLKKDVELKLVDERQVLLQIWEQDRDGYSNFSYNSNAQGKKKQGILSFKYIKQEQQVKEETPKKKQEKKELSPVKNKEKEETPKKKQQQSQKKIQEQVKQEIREQENKQKSQPIIQIQEKEQLKQNKLVEKNSRILKLPSIVETSSYGDKIFDRQSTATLQKSILAFSIPKAPRFGNRPRYSGEPSYYNDTCFSPTNKKGVGFGYGHKRQFPQWMQKNMKQNPGPGNYQYQTQNNFKPKGPTFGIAHKYYEKVIIPKQKKFVASQRLKPIKKLR